MLTSVVTITWAHDFGFLDVAKATLRKRLSALPSAPGRLNEPMHQQYAVGKAASLAQSSAMLQQDYPEA